MKRSLSLQYIIIVSILYVLLVAFSSFYPSWYNWGVSPLHVYNGIELAIVLLSMGITLIPFVQKRLLIICTLLTGKYQNLSLRYRQIILLSFLAISGFFFWKFNQKLFFLGDGYLLLRNLPSINAPIEVFGFYKNSPLSGFIFYTVSLLTKNFAVENYALMTYQLVSILCGIATIFLLIKIGKYLFTDITTRIVFIIGVLSSAASQMFFSYVENYSVVILILIFYFYCSTRYLIENKYFIIVTLSFIALILSHYAMMLTGLSYLFLLYKEFIQKRYRSTAFNLILISVTVISLYFAVYDKYPLLYDHVFKENSHVLTDSIPGSLDFSYSILSSYHIIDATNLILFVFPFSLLLIPYVIWSVKFQAIVRNETFVFFTLCAFGTLLFLFGMKSDLGLSRDWDLYTLYLIPTVVVTVFFIIKSASAETIIPHAFIFIGITLIHTIAWIAINTSEDYSLKYFTSLPNETLWSKKAVTHTMDELGSYFHQKKDYQRSLQYNLKYLDYDPDNIRIIENVASIYYFIYDDNVNAQLWYGKAVNAKSRDWQVYNNLAEIKMKQQNFPSAMILLDKSIRLNPQSSTTKLNIAFILGTVMNQKKDALVLYEQVLQFEPENTNALLNAGYLSYQLNNYVQTKKYLRRYLKILPNSPEGNNIQNLLNSL